MRSFIDRIIPRYAHLPLLMCGITQILAYFCTKYIDIMPYADMSLPLDHMIEVWPAWVIPYVLSYVYWVVGYIAVCRVSRRSCRLLCRADYISKIFAAICFVLVPTTISRPELSDGICEWALEIIYRLDTPENLFPSMHCLFSWLLARELADIKDFPGYVRWGAVVFSFLVFASTVFTRQHYLVDIPAGVAVAEISRFISHRLESRNTGSRRCCV